MTRHMKRAGPGVDPHLPGRAGVEEADRGAHGQGQGHAGILGHARIKPGRILFEIDGVTIALAKEALALAAAKLPIKTRFIERIAE